VVDQFEELFTYAEAGSEQSDESEAFVTLLIRSTADLTQRVFACLTMRTDFLGQCVRFLTAAIWRRFAPRTLDLEIFFWRPVFWDDTVTVMADEQDGRWKAVCLVANGKVTTEARITDLTA